MKHDLLQVKTAARVGPGLGPRLGMAALALLAVAGVQASDPASCISAGRMDAEGRWAPQFQEVRLLDEAGRALPTRSKADLARVRGVELTQPALLSACTGERGLPREDKAGTKAPVPAAKPGRLTVDGVGYAKLQTGGELVELRVRVAADQVVMITR